jgi:hypothetical protein
MRTRSAFIGWVALALPVLLASCAAQQASFRPLDANTYAKGDRATFYDISVDAERLGIARVYSEGAYTTPANDSQPVIDVRLRIRNLSNGPMSLDLDKCGINVDTDSGELALTRPLQTTNLNPILPGDTGQIALSYPLEGRLHPEDVNSFDFDWTVTTEKGPYANTTPFVRGMVQNAYAYYPAYGGWWGYPWGYPWGWDGPGWGWSGGGGVDWGLVERGEEGHGGEMHGGERHGGGGRHER